MPIRPRKPFHSPLESEYDNPAKRLMARRHELESIADVEELRHELVQEFSGPGMSPKSQVRWVRAVQQAPSLFSLQKLLYDFILGASGLSKAAIGLDDVEKDDSLTVSENVEILCCGERILLEKGDKIVLVS